MKNAVSSRRAQPGFTLIEIILAMAMLAIVLAAVNGVLFAAFKLRDRAHAAVDEAVPREQALAVMRRDLLSTMPAAGVLSGYFKAGTVSSTGLGEPVSLEFCASTGALHAGQPWGDIQRVAYQLKDSSAPGSMAGKDLYRNVTRNLLASTPPEPDRQWMLGGVESFEVQCFDGSTWLTSWDTSTANTNLPAAVRVRIVLTPRSGVRSGVRQPIELLTPLVSQSMTNLIQNPNATTSTGN